MSDFDLVIRGATVYDGSGAPPADADVAVRGERIAVVGRVAGRGNVELEAAGLALTPGFIDVHSHDDFAVVLHPEMDFKTCQGVTTDVVGNCGMGAAPFDFAKALGSVFHPGHTLPEWQGYSGYLQTLDAEPPSCNVAVLIGHGTLRGAAMGVAPRAPDPAELSRMREDLREGLEAGAVGYSTGLIYEPGRNAATDELVTLAKDMSEIGGLYATHMRDEGRGLLRSVAEAIEIGETGGVPVQISHHKAAGRDAWGLVKESLALIEAARDRGLDVTADQYPYTAGSTVLAAVVQNAEKGGLGRVGGRGVVIVSAQGHPEWEGSDLQDLADEWGVGALDAARRVLEADGGAWVVMHSMSEDDVRTVMRHPTTMIGSDGIPTEGGKPHPRLYGTFPRVLGRYAREEALFPLEVAVHRMTGLPATKFRLEGRGFVREGAAADLVLFDPGRIADVGTYDDPRRPPAGIGHVFVNGTAVVRDGAHTGARPGRALRRS